MIEAITLHTLTKIKIIFLAVLLIKSFVLMMEASCSLQRKNSVYRFIEAILKEYLYCKKVIKKHFNTNLVMSAEDEERFQLSNKCWLCDKVFNVGDNKIRYHCHVTEKYGDSAHWTCNINLGLTKKSSWNTS